MIKLWSGVLSNNAAKVRVVLGEKGIPFEALNIPWTRAGQWGHKPQAFLDVSPRAQVPVLIDADVVLHDSTVINEYLEEAYPALPLMPSTPAARALCRLWEDEADFQQQYVGVLIRDVFLAEPGTELSDAAVTAMEALSQYVDRLDGIIGEKDTLCDEYSLADISTFMTLTFAQTLGVAVTQPNVVRWLARMMERPVVATEYESMMAAAAVA